MKTKKFQRSDVNKYLKLGLKRKNKIKYRKAKGRDNKIRLKMKGHLRNVSTGFRTAKKERGLINGLKPVLVYNLADLEKVKEGEIVIVGKIGTKKKSEIAKKAQEKKIQLANLNPKKFLKTLEIKLKKLKESKTKKEKAKIEKNKKSRKAAEKKEKEEAVKKEKEEKGEETAGTEKNKPEKTETKKESEKPKIKKEAKDDKKIEEKSKIESKSKDNKKEIQTNNYGRGK
jgi:large subunit ribosomal protein L32e